MEKEEFTTEEGRQLLKIARDAIVYYLEHDDVPYFPVENDRLRKERGVFVTLRKDHKLRGCIGYPLPVKPLNEAVVDNAIAAAFHDPRFQPLDKSELGDIEIEISILTMPEEVKVKNAKEYPEKIKIGRDGLLLEYGRYSGLLLPQVPVEEGWDSRTYLNYICIKSGLPPDAWEKLPIRLSTFQAQIFSEK